MRDLNNFVEQILEHIPCKIERFFEERYMRRIYLESNRRKKIEEKKKQEYDSWLEIPPHYLLK